MLFAGCMSVLGCMGCPPATSHHDTMGSDGEQSCTRESGQTVQWDLLSTCCREESSIRASQAV